MRFSQRTVNENETSPRAFVEWMRRVRLLRTQIGCPACRRPMVLQGRTAVRDNVTMRCLQCRRVRSVRRGSWFESHPKLSLPQLVRLGVAYNSGASISSTARQWNLTELTVSECFGDFRRRISLHVDARVVPGPRPFTGAPVQIDCATFKHFKDTINHVQIPVLHVQGILEPYTGVFRYQVVMDQKATTLRPPISALVPVGTIVMTDEHKSYQTLDDDGYYHYRVNHQPRRLRT